MGVRISEQWKKVGKPTVSSTISRSRLWILMVVLLFFYLCGWDLLNFGSH